MKIVLVKNNIVENMVNVETYEESKKLFPDNNLVIESEITGLARLGARFNGEKFEPQQPYPSWVWNEKTFSYDPPKPKPEGDYYWSESSLEWLPVPVEPADTET